MSLTTQTAVLLLEDGRKFTGKAYGSRGTSLGEIVFSTGMSGYQETFTDPSYLRQIVVMTAPHIGNTGVNDDDPESTRIWIAGVVVRDPARRSSNWRATGELVDELEKQNIVGISDIDTRALTRHLRDKGVMKAGIFSGAALLDGDSPRTDDQLLEIVRSQPDMAGANLIDEVTTKEPYKVAALSPEGEELAEPRAVVVAIDLGIKAMTNERLAHRGVEVRVLPAGASIDEVLAHNPDGVFFSNGPGDPATAEREISLLREVLDRRIPYFGICFGNQLFGRALGLDTYKLRFGHRGINQPVLDVETGKVEITSQNHGFAIAAPLNEVFTAPHDGGRYGRVKVSHIGLNDDVVEGLAALDLPAFSVQYHPEAAAGPHDGSHLFDRFIDLMIANRSKGAQA